MVYSVFRRPLPCNPSTAHMCLSHRRLRNTTLLSACTGHQIRASHAHNRLLIARVADVLVDHVTAGRARSVANLRQQCAAPNGSPTLHLLMGQRARNFYDFERLLHPTLLADRRYIKLNFMGFVATALGVNIVVWVPGPGGDIVVHRQHQVSIGRSTFCVDPHTQRLHHCHITRYFALYGTSWGKVLFSVS